MGIVEISASSLEYVRVPVSAAVAGAAIDPTSNTVKMAFISGDATPTAGQLKTGSWDTDTGTDPDTYYAQCLVGPGGTATLTPGIYQVWVQVTDNPEVPLKRCGPLKVV